MTLLPMICAEKEKIDPKSATEVLICWPFLSVKYASMDLHTSIGRPGRTDFPPLLPLSLAEMKCIVGYLAFIYCSGEFKMFYELLFRHCLGLRETCFPG